MTSLARSLAPHDAAVVPIFRGLWVRVGPQTYTLRYCYTNPRTGLTADLDAVVACVGTEWRWSVELCHKHTGISTLADRESTRRQAITRVERAIANLAW